MGSRAPPPRPRTVLRRTGTSCRPASRISHGATPPWPRVQGSRAETIAPPPKLAGLGLVGLGIFGDGRTVDPSRNGPKYLGDEGFLRKRSDHDRTPIVAFRFSNSLLFQSLSTESGGESWTPIHGVFTGGAASERVRISFSATQRRSCRRRCVAKSPIWKIFFPLPHQLSTRPGTQFFGHD